jgi:hypothetical protein
MDDPLSTRDLVKILRLKEGGGLALKDAIATVVLSRYSTSEYDRLYEYHSSIMRELRDLTGGDEQKDPFEDIRAKYADITAKQKALDTEKADLRTAVKRELLQELLVQKEG